MLRENAYEIIYFSKKTQFNMLVSTSFVAMLLDGTRNMQMKTLNTSTKKLNMKW